MTRRQAVDSLSDRSIYLQRTLKVKGKVSKATVYVVGLGFYELSINSQKVGDAMFAPLWSDYDKSGFYNEYDVSTYFVGTDGKTVRHNSIRVLLGNGFYQEKGKRYAKLKISFVMALKSQLWVSSITSSTL